MTKLRKILISGELNALFQGNLDYTYTFEKLAAEKPRNLGFL